jgi:hypothetical protein
VQTREPSDPDNNCAEHLCITRIWAKGVKGANLYFSNEVSEIDVRDKLQECSPSVDDELEFDEMMEESVDCEYKEN